MTKDQGQGSAPLTAEFELAAESYGVPAEILMAMAYVNSRFEMPPLEVSEYRLGSTHGRGAYGVMQLVQNPSSNTLGEAAKLTGISEERLKTDRASNILGGAALLASSQGEPKPEDLGGWLGAVDGRGGNGRTYGAVAGVGGGELYVGQVVDALKDGFDVETYGGERIVLAPQRITDPRAGGGESR